VTLEPVSIYGIVEKAERLRKSGMDTTIQNMQMVVPLRQIASQRQETSEEINVIAFVTSEDEQVS